MSQNTKKLVREIAQELSMQGFLLEHEVTLRGDWQEAKVDKSVLYAVASKLNEQIAALLKAAAE
jgi:ribosomal protein S8